MTTYVNTILLFFDHQLCTSMWTFLTLNVDKNRDFFGSPLLIHLVIECPRTVKSQAVAYLG